MASQKLLKSLLCRNDGLIKRFYSIKRLSNEEVTRKRSELFGQEKARQMALNKSDREDRSPSQGSARELYTADEQRTFNAVQLCHARFGELVHFCSVMFLNAFKDEQYVELCSFPPPDVRSGSFVYDVDLKLPNWNPSRAELNCLGRLASKLCYEDVSFERLEVDASIAAKMFEDNRFKSAQIPQIAEQSSTGSTVVVYRLKDHVDITKGPLIASPQLIGRFCVTAVHSIDSPDYGTLRRVQGLSLPKQLAVHFWTYDILCERASKPNTQAAIPGFAKVTSSRKVAGS